MRCPSLAVLLVAAGALASGCTDGIPTQPDETGSIGPALKKAKPIVIDGVLGAAEWTGGGSLQFKANAPEGVVGGWLYIKNDADSIYLAVKIDRSTAGGDGTAAFEFDNNNNGIAFEDGDDALLFGGGFGTGTLPAATAGPIGDWYRTSVCSGGAVTCTRPDQLDLGGTTDGRGALGDDGFSTIYEMSHPLSSGDVGHDFALSASGSTIGFILELVIAGPTGPVLHTNVPTFTNALGVVTYCSVTTGTLSITCPSGLVSFIRVDPTVFTLAVGGTQQLTATGYQLKGGTVSTGPCFWTSENTGVATVDFSTGLVTGVAAGVTTILATCQPTPGVASSWPAQVTVQ